MPRTVPTALTERLTDVVTGVLGTGWTPPASLDWPASFLNEAAGRELTIYPDRLNNRLTFITASTDDFDCQRLAKYTPDLTGHDTIDDWIADADLDAAADSLAVILQRLVDQPLPERIPRPDPLEREREQLAKQAKELAAHAGHFAAGLIWSQPVTDDARGLATLAQRLACTATRVDELRGHTRTR
ncbi:hypothetical protein [Streptomyces sp. NPDC056987]|uniref:hypothetical protein n=1 Tax=Streptomyces sp. NPDC056987 TaxID=3345988 RepID=UPI003642BF23